MLPEIRHEFLRHQQLAEKALAQIDDATFFQRPGSLVNSIALIVKHLTGNLRSRWLDFLTTDGEKPDRDRDGEFVLLATDTRANLMEAWQASWGIVYGSLDPLSDQDLQKTVTIRGEPHSVLQALLRSVTHVSYHVGQIAYLVRLLNPESQWLTIPPGASQQHSATYVKSKSDRL